MTWRGGKKIREDVAEAATPSFACLKPLLKATDTDLPRSFQKLAKSLSKLDSAVRIHIRLVDGNQTVNNWEVKAGPSLSSAVEGEPKVARGRQKEPGILLVVSVDTWVQIARGELAPFDALFAGKLRVGGNLSVGKKITQLLSDPTVPFVSPC